MVEKNLYPPQGQIAVDVAPGTITDSDVAANAAIQISKLEALASARLIVGSAANVPTARDITGDVTIGNTGITAIAGGVIVNADIDANAAIAFSKLAALTSANILVGSAANVPTAVAMTGDVSITNGGVTSISSGLTTMRGSSSLSSVVAVLTAKGAIIPAASNPTQSDVTGVNHTYTVLDYPDGSSTNAFWDFIMPTGIGTNKNLTIKIFWISTVNAGAVVWGASALGRTSAEAYDAALAANTEATTTTAGTAGQVNITTITINASGVDADDAVIVRISRNGGAGGDTMAANARFLQAVISWA